MSNKIKAGSHVHHKPTGEDWVLLGVNYETNEVCVKGWPPTIAKLSDCVFLEEGKPLEQNEIDYRIKEFGSRWL